MNLALIVNVTPALPQKLALVRPEVPALSVPRVRTMLTAWVDELNETESLAGHHR